MAKKLTKPIALFFTVFAVLVAALLYFGALDITTSAAWDGKTTAGFGGDGSEASPFEIANGEQLANLAKTVNEGETYSGQFFKLTANIDLGENEWTPIGGENNYFEGTFDGNGYTVSNFTINKPEESYIGLFGYNKGTIMNLGVEKAEISGSVRVGGVCGYNYGTIKNCYNTGAVSGTISVIGGVCGFNTGYNNTITNCYNASTVNGKNSAGSVCGYSNDETVTNCYYNKDFCAVGGIKGSDVDGSATGLTSEELCNGTLDNLAGFEKSVWEPGKSFGVKATEGRFGTITYTYPSLIGVGSAATPDIPVYNFGTSDSSEWQRFTEITTADQFKAIGEDKTSWGKNYVLGNDIVFEDGTELTPIGNSAKPFTGKFSGNGHTVSNFTINKPNINNIGLFGKNKGTIMNLGVENAEINGYNYVGGVCGYNYGTIQNCYNTGAVNGDNDVGGVCGHNSGTIKNCYNTGAVSGTGRSSANIGGVCGYNYSGSTIKDCYNTGAVSGTRCVGGVCGYNYSGSTIKDCYNTGAVSGTRCVGGVCGYNNKGGTIQNCYNTGTVSGTDEYVGGVCGDNYRGTIQNCYNAGTVKGNGGQIGGVCGYNPSGTITNCYYNKDICTVGGIKGSDVDGSATGLTTFQMTDGKALETMGFGADWSKKNIDKENSIAYYPDLAVFADDKPSVKYETKLVIEPADKNAEYKYGDDVKFNVSALVKFDGMADFAADTTAVTKSKGSFKVTVDGEPVVDSMDIFDNTTAEAVIPSIKIIGDKTFMLVYDGTNSAYIASGTATCKVSIAKLDLTEDDFTFTEPTTLIYDGMAKEATVTANDGITGVGEITVKYYAGDTEAQPIDAGVYTVKIDVAEGDFCKSAHDLTADDWKFTIAKGTQTVTADDVTLTYGETGKITASTDRDGAISYEVKTGDDVISVAADGTITALKAGTATVEITAAETANYAPSTKTVNVTVSKVSVTIIANSYTIKVGDNLPAYDYEVTGLVNGDALPIDVTISCAADGKTAGEFPITVSGVADSDNYTFSYTNGTLIVSNKETQTITADDVTLTYGETGKISATINGDGAISYAVKTGDDIISVAADGTITALKTGTATVEITAAETDTYAKAVKAVTVTVNKAAVTITAKNYTIKVGAALPDFDYEVTGLANGEKLPIKVTISCTADGKTAGEYPITVSGAAESTNYTFTYTNGTLIVSNKETQTVTADDVTLTYGETGKITASTNGDGAISYAVTAGSDVISVAADGTITALKAGTATVEITAAETDTYTKAVKAVTVTVNKAAVKITAKSYTIKVGAALPAYDYEVTGLVNGEALPITVTISCTAADSNTAGTFPITVSGAADSDNYTFSYINGTLTIGEKEPVSTPVFSPASGTTFTSSQKITISCATEGAAIYYTTDGTEPTTASTLYNGAFTITATTTIKAIAVKEGMADSPAATAAYTKRSSSGGSGGTGGGSSRPITPTEPNYPTIGGSSKSWSDIAADLAKLANGSEVTIQLNGNTAVPVEIIKKIADTDSKVTFVIDSVFTWVVDGAKITVPAAADLSFIRIASQKHDVLRGIEGTQFRINNTDVPAGLEIAFKSEHAGKFANLYKSVDGKLVFVTCAKLGADGKVLLPGITEKGDYIVMLCEFSDLPGDMSNDGVLNAMDASAILKDIVGLESGVNPLMADFNGDGNVNAMDASAILKRIVGLI